MLLSILTHIISYLLYVNYLLSHSVRYIMIISHKCEEKTMQKKKWWSRE